MTEIESQAINKEDVGAGAAAEAVAPETARAKHARGLLAIGIFKLSKALFFFALGMGALNLVHRNVGELFLRIAAWFHFDPEGQFVSMLQDKLDLVSNHQLRQVSILSILYGVVSTTEGVGLMLQQKWAEYLTLILTICALPLELFEIARHPTISRFTVLGLNLLVLAYLLWFIRRSRRQAREAGAS